ncbi:Glutamyl-tRNA(Gln) amidotransferase subunit A, mitochondrial [Pseudocercospora fuligena]|uniref:Glutamyl-tRNA(Gln) amidotransferase subunit A, mitochondrial n=1 Tax=Pseudocercospora fuligena TaxID=685502 RepID=A0A8H6RL27_9PEZI|nr:Glutamyl-tRNA(Gln) amidotransferase subunit A, mitochondrial [Pseudocercospora fuligena]
MPRKRRDITPSTVEEEPCFALPDHDHELDHAQDDAWTRLQERRHQLSLTKKKSWFSSVKDTVARSATLARTTVDQWRIDAGGGKSYLSDADEYEDRVRDAGDGTASSRKSSSAGGSATPLRQTRAERDTPATPKTAAESLRAQLFQSTAKTGKTDRKKRGALAKIVTSAPTGPEAFDHDPLEGVETTKTPVATIKGHGRKSSVARSLAGSFRTLGRRGTQSTKCGSPVKGSLEDNLSPTTKQAASIPLPSSPVKIPAPNLNRLELGSSGLMSTSFIHSPELERRSELLALTDPSWKHTQRVPTYYTKLPGEGPDDRPLLSASSSRDASLSSCELLELPTDDFGFSMPDEPATPATVLPGNSVRARFDGANDETAVFERSVESKNSASKQKDKKLKKMGSIDALAEQCARAIGSPEGTSPAKGDKVKDMSRQTTASVCPSDIPPLTRQMNQRIVELQSPSNGHRDPVSGPWQSEDPFAPANTVRGVSTGRMPSSERTVELPLRPKIRVQSVNGSRPRTIDISPDRTSEEDNIPLALLAQQKTKSRIVSEAPTNLCINIPYDEYERELRRKPSVADSLQQLQDKTNDIDQHYAERKSRDSKPYCEESGENAETTKSEQAEPRAHEQTGDSPVATSIYQFISSHASSPHRNRPGTTHSPDMGKAFWKEVIGASPQKSKEERKKTVQQWVQTQQTDAGTPGMQHSPRHSDEYPDVVSISIDEDRTTPPLSPQDSTPNVTPSMGDRLDFDARGSDRNMRYNALKMATHESPPRQEDWTNQGEIPSSLRPVLQLITDDEGEGSEHGAEGFEDGRAAPSPSLASSYRKKVAHEFRYSKELSSDSIEADLQEALEDNYAFQLAMSGVDLSDSPGQACAAGPTSSPFGPFQENVDPAEPESLPSPTARSDSDAGSVSSKDSKVYTFGAKSVEEPDPVAITSDEVVAPMSTADSVDSLDDALEMYISYNASQQAVDTASTFHQRRANGRSIGIKANIVAKDAIGTGSAAASRMLSPYNSPFDSTVVKLLKERNAVLQTHQNMDEFGMGSHSQYSHDGPVKSTYSRGGIPLSPGGSSGGSAVAVAAGECVAALGTDTGGSVRLPAAYTGILGFKPSYGRISRWGVIQYANSLDTVGILGKEVDTVRSVFEVLDKCDGRDPTSMSESLRQRISSNTTKHDPEKLRIGIPLEYNIAELSPIVRETWMAVMYALEDLGPTFHPISLPSTRSALSAYYVLAPAEASSNLAKYDGIRYGYRTAHPDASPNADPPLPLYAETRGTGFGEEVQRRILLGAYTLSSEAMDNYFIQAQKVRRIVQDDFNGVFAASNPLLDANETRGEVDIILAPTAPTLPPTIEDLKLQSPVESYMNDVFTVPASLVGLPAMTVPAPLPPNLIEMMDETDVKTAGMQVIGQFGDDQLVLDAGEMLQEALKLASRHHPLWWKGVDPGR